MTTSVAAGVDWAGDGWLAVFFEDGSYCGYAFEGSFEDLWDEQGLPDTVLVDVPIGLPEGMESLTAREELDSRARTVTNRSSSVFPVPSRAACQIAYEDGASYEAVAEQNETDLEKGLNWQSYYIAAGIGEVEAFLQRNDAAEETVLESHPEVCFRTLLGRPLKYSKTSAPGVGERLEALEDRLDSPGKTLAKVTTDLQGESAEIDVDDVLDAVVLGVTASVGTENLKYLRPRDSETDPTGVPIQMAYWSPEVRAEQPLTCVDSNS